MRKSKRASKFNAVFFNQSGKVAFPADPMDGMFIVVDAFAILLIV